MRTIRVSGKGKLSLKPDLIELTLRTSGTYKEYSDTIRRSAEQTRILKETLKSAGLDSNDLKTTSFDIDTAYESYKDYEGNSKSKFVGYEFIHRTYIKFANDNELLGKVLYSLSRCPIKVKFDIDYTISDREGAKDQLLKNAIADATHKAKVLAESADVNLGEIVDINYSWGEIRFSSSPINTFALDSKMMAMSTDSYDIDYDGIFIDANGRYVIRLVYKEKSQAASVVWYRALINFGDLEKFIDFDLSYVLGKDGKTQYKFEDVKDIKGKGFDLGKAAGDRTTNRKNLPINLVLNEGVDLNKLGNENYIVQMRLTDGKYERVYAYAPKGTSMDYSTYTKTTSVDLVDKLGTLFIKGGYQKDGKNATNQEFFMSEFIANPEQYSDKSNLGIIRTQYMGQATTIVRDTIGDQPFAFTQVFDANLVKYMKADSKDNVAYVNVLTNNRELSPYSKNVGIPKDKINYANDDKIAYIVIGTDKFTKKGVKVVNIPKNDQHTMLSGFYITAIDYVVNKSLFEDTFAGRTKGIDATRKLNYTTMSGWTNPNTDGWTIFEKEYANEYVVPEGESYLIDTTVPPSGGQIMIQVGGDQAILRKPQGYYNGYVSGDGANDAIEEFAKGVYEFTLREGATILPGKKLRVYMPYTASHDHPVNFLEIHNGTKLDKGGATLKLQKDRNINMHIYTDLPRGASFKLKYTLKGEKSQKDLVFTKPKGLSTFWKYSDDDKVLTGLANTSILSSAGNFYINTTKLEPGKDIYVEAYDENGKEIVERKSWFKYVPLTKSTENVKNLTWTDHSDKKAVLSINKSLYTPYQILFTNDYAEGTDDFYKNPRVLPANNDGFKKDTKEFVGYTKYDGGKVRTLYEEGKIGRLFAKVQAAENEYDDKGNLKGDDVRKPITIAKKDIFDAQFAEDSKSYMAYEYKVDLTKMLPYHSDNKTETPLTLLKDMKFVSTASDGSSLPSDLLETRVRARVLFDANTGKLADGKDKVVKIVPDNTKFYGEDGYVANGFEGANVEANTGDKFPEAPKLEGKNFLGWVTEAGKTALGNKAVVTADEFNKLPKDQIFTNETPITKHLVVYAVYSNEVTVTFDANQGTFTDGKDTTNVKVEGGNVTKPTDPTREGYTFKGWADKKDATEADANILNSVTEPKTVYAVWEKNATEELKLAEPEKVEVKDTKSLTSDEIDKVKKAVAEANKDKGITEADVTVAEDGTVTVTKNGKTGTLGSDKTVKQKEVKNEFNPPKEPVKVDKIGELKPDEIAAIKKAVKDANPDRNFKDDEITVKPDGTVEINQGGKVGTIPADKTVVQKDTIKELQAPEKTEVKDPTNLTKAERDKVAAAVKAKNNLADGDKIEVDSKGNVKVTTADGKKTGTLEGKDTVKPFTRDGKKLNPPANKVKVGDTNKLTEAEKQAVRDEIKKANPELGFTDDEIQVDPNGTVTVPITDSKNGTFEPNQTIEAATDADKTIKLVAPEKVLVADKNKLDNDDKDAVKKAIKDANPTLNLQDSDIEVADDGSVTVTRGEGENQKVGQLAQADTVIEKLKKPEAKALSDGSVVVTPKDERTEELEITFGDATNPTTVTAKKVNGKWTLADGTDPSIKIDEESGLVTIPAKMLKNNDEVKAKAKAGAKELVSEEAKVSSKDDEAPAAPEVKAEDDGSVKVTPPVDEDTKSVEIKYTDAAGQPQTLVATKENGEWKLPEGTDASIKINQATGVVTLPKNKIKVGEKVTAKAKDANENESAAGETTPVDKTELKAEVAKNNDDAIKKSDKYKNADQTKKDAYDSALDKANMVLNDPNALQKDIDDALQQLKEAEEALDGTATPAALNAPEKPVEVKNPSNLTPEEKEAVKKAVKDANPNLPEGANIEVGNDGSVTVTKDGTEIGTIPANKTVKAALNAPEKPVEVKNPSNLTPEEKEAVKKAVKDANPNLPEGTNIEVGNDGSVTVTKDRTEIGTIPANKTVKAALNAPEKPVEVKNPSNLTPEEKKAVEDAVKKANPTLPADATVTVGNDGTVTVTDANGMTIGTLTPAQTVKTAGTPTPQLDKSREPNVDPIYDSDDYVTGTGVPGSTIVVRFPDGLTETTVVEDDGRWAVRVPYILYDGVRIYVTQIEKDMTESDPVSAEVRYDDEYWRERDRYSRYDRRDKEVKEVKEEKKPTKPTKAEPRWTPSQLNSIDHFAYIKGYGDNKFEPNKTITRAEVAMIFARLSLNKSTAGAPQFKDVKAGDWYKTAIDIIARQGVIKGYEDGTFRPNQPITRREFAAIAARYAGNIDTWKTFRDVPPTDWAYTLINRVAGAGWINGYEDGTFRPNNNITRAEVVAIVNRMLNRTADKAYVENNLMNSSNAFVDNMRSAWYYYDIYEAAFGHSYERMMNGVDEKWNRVNGQAFEVIER